METDTVSVAQSNAIREINASVLDKSLLKRDETFEQKENNSVDKSSKYSEPDKGGHINLFA